jgi:hypothetical protein
MKYQVIEKKETGTGLERPQGMYFSPLNTGKLKTNAGTGMVALFAVKDSIPVALENFLIADKIPASLVENYSVSRFAAGFGMIIEGGGGG